MEPPSGGCALVVNWGHGRSGQGASARWEMTGLRRRRLFGLQMLAAVCSAQCAASGNVTDLFTGGAGGQEERAGDAGAGEGRARLAAPCHNHAPASKQRKPARAAGGRRADAMQ
jgi:hypothetical protein